jgi:hypothetical protein
VYRFLIVGVSPIHFWSVVHRFQHHGHGFRSSFWMNKKGTAAGMKSEVVPVGNSAFVLL